MKYYVGIDIGASTTKALILDGERQVLGSGVVFSGADFSRAADEAFKRACEPVAEDVRSSCFITTTGYGRKNIAYADQNMTEISCHALGTYHHFPHPHTVVDIGGQDSKVITVEASGNRTHFRMNRKCAAGTGAFLEEMANRLQVELDDLNELALQAEQDIEINSYCTVFAASEILTRIREGVSVPDIVRGVFNSVIRRVIEMDPLEGSIVLCGGVVAYFPVLAKMFETRLGREIFVPPLPQLTGALGAALYSWKAEGDKNA
ncbi:MAG: ATPase [Candidatus Delongbacteria bacterium]|nr:ATPase [Candidatus Delongbacteria bacterium]